MATFQPIRWGILGTANIARRAFLPGLRSAGGGIAYAVASRNGTHAQKFAAENGIEHGVEGYEALLEDEAVQAVYNPLPNSLHAEWTIAALRAGKAVLCEKPLTPSEEEAASVLDVARETGALLWEAFVFPFHRQMSRLLSLISEGALGDVRQVQSSFNFTVHDRDDIRLSPVLGGGGLLDVGCYCVRLARLVFDADAERATAMARWATEGVDVDMQGVLAFSGDRRLIFSAGMSGPDDTFTRVVGTEGEVRMSNPFHPGEGDRLEVRRGGTVEVEDASEGAPTFAPAIAHIHEVVLGHTAPLHLAIHDSLGNAHALDLLRASAERES